MQHIYLDRLQQLRAKMRYYMLDAYFVSNMDEFQYVHNIPDINNVMWLTGFAGSYGMLLLTQTELFLFTDSRYVYQARNEIDTYNILQCKVVDIVDKLDVASCINAVSKLRVVGYTSTVYTKCGIDFLMQKLHLHATSLCPMEKDLVNEVRNAVAQDNVGNTCDCTKKDGSCRHSVASAFVVPETYHQCDYHTKVQIVIKAVIAAMWSNKTEANNDQHTSFTNADARYVLFTSSTSLCWLLNIRGTDTSHTPIILMYGILDTQNAQLILFVKLLKNIPSTVRQQYDDSVIWREFGEIYEFFHNIVCNGEKIYVDCKRSPMWFSLRVNDPAMRVHDPITYLKAQKNSAEIAAMRTSHMKDAIAWCKFFAWIEQQLLMGGVITEMSAACQLLKFQRDNADFICQSFETISALNAHAAIIHYRTTPANDTAMDTSSTPGIYLCDAGGQYLYGTTDITRTIRIHNTNDEKLDFAHIDDSEVKLYYTAVLRAHISLASMIFPHYTTCAQLDAVARQQLWHLGVDYAHSTGHGVGYCLAVHEEPYHLNKHSTETLNVGAVISIEPGFYKKDEYGIRLENLYFVKESRYTGFFEFEPLTLVPFDMSLVIDSQLTKKQRLWLREYHNMIRKVVLPHLDSVTTAMLRKRYFAKQYANNQKITRK